MRPRSLRLLFVFAVVLFSLLHASLLNAVDNEWTDSDRKAERSGDALYNQGNFDEAEAIYRRTLDRHPDSPQALMYHVKALDAQHRFPEALYESKRAVAMNPDDPVALEWLGMTLVLSGSYLEAIATLEKGLKLNAEDETTSIWLAEAYRKSGNMERGDSILQRLFTTRPDNEKGRLAARIANMFYETGESELAVTWWRRSAAEDCPEGARWLSWAYSTGYGVPQDDGGSEYWARRSAEAPFAWFPRVTFADGFVAWENGWGLVMIILLLPALLPILTITLFGMLFRFVLSKDPALLWTERARRSYPFQVFLGFCGLLLPFVYIVNLLHYPAFALPVPKWILGWLVLAIGAITCSAMVARCSRLYRNEAGTAWQNLYDVLCLIFLFFPTLFVLAIMQLFLPDQWNVQAALMILAAVLLYLWIQYGGWVRMGRLIRLLAPADDTSRQDAASIAQRWNLPAPSVWLIGWRRANAFALPFANTIVLTKRLRSELSRHQVNAIMAHEIAHLCEDKVTRFMRLWLPMLLLLPLFTIGLWVQWTGWTGLLGCYVFLILGLVILRKRSRRMEERADTFGKTAETDTGEYPQALAKLYEINLIPAVMRGKRKVHPHLYDRLIAAGQVPDYPRPKPPSPWGVMAGFGLIALNAACLAAVWLSLF